jgi:AraC-like DNA-binding protein
MFSRDQLRRAASLTNEDFVQLGKCRRPHNRLGFAYQVPGPQHLLRRDDKLGLAEVALRVGFSDQSQFSFHFKRIVGVTPRQFRISARTR